MKKFEIFENFGLKNKTRFVCNMVSASWSPRLWLHFRSFSAIVKFTITEKFPFQTSWISFKNFKSARKKLPPNASNLRICSIVGERSLGIKTIFNLMESPGEQIKIRKIGNFFVISHVKDNEGSMLALC